MEIDLATDSKFKIFTLVGLNESGKTTVLEAINFFDKGAPAGQEHTLIPKNKKGNFNDAVSVTAVLELDAEDARLIKETAKQAKFKIKDGLDLESIKIEVERRNVFKSSRFDSTNSEPLWTTNIYGTEGKKQREQALEDCQAAFDAVTDYITENLVPPIIYYPNFLTKFPQRIYLQAKPAEDGEQEFYRDVLQDVLDSLESGYNIEDHLIARINSSRDEDVQALNVVLKKMGAKITSIVFKTWEDLFTSTGKQIVLEKGKEKDPTTGVEYPYLDIKLQEGSDEYFIGERSLGFTWFFSFLLFTEFRKNRVGDKGEILFLIDEPASNLHSTAQTKLLKTFEKIVSKSRLIYTTHSHHLINSEWLEGAYIVKNKAIDYNKESLDFDALKTEVTITPYKRFAAENPHLSTYFQPILDTLDYQPSHLEMVDEIVIVEGKNDFYTLKYIHDYILSDAERKRYKLHFYPGGGAGKNLVVIKLYAAWSRKFAVLMDGDKAGESAKETYIEEVGETMRERIFTLQGINPKWKDFSTEDLFSAPEKLRIIKEVFPEIKTYSKNHFNLAIQNLIASKTKVTVTKPTLKRFNKIYKDVKQVL